MTLRIEETSDTHLTVTCGDKAFGLTPLDDLVAGTQKVIGNDALDLFAIELDLGAGQRFTTTRQCVVVANAIGFALGIPVNNVDFVIPIYHKEPNITVSKKAL
ncbi:hypothetical protein COY32_00970 [candidate division WWE3 bacterium CG_4_10_14_0_2_um_filter_41_14]|uniref:Uncharacterized protein n=1 Tax=candidate division WWE3 bacterium CG_4_10_14_0_2_um_filter_41_14 TaxID=1975072 RepID=A0A2M7TLF5_UNCKA|nr:MAG: hypothetical protein COY32_00970 [candidate division WWE3 bacterium CG_4_10_14_0_2_um_filter_41_14]